MSSDIGKIAVPIFVTFGKDYQVFFLLTCNHVFLGYITTIVFQNILNFNFSKYLAYLFFFVESALQLYMYISGVRRQYWIYYMYLL